jgi:hypothetical protein
MPSFHAVGLGLRAACTRRRKAEGNREKSKMTRNRALSATIGTLVAACATWTAVMIWQGPSPSALATSSELDVYSLTVDANALPSQQFDAI